MSAVDSSSDKYSKCPTFRPLDFDNSLKELRSYCLGGKPLCLVSTLPDPVTMYVHARSAAVNAYAAAGALQDPQYQLALWDPITLYSRVNVFCLKIEL